MRDSLTCDPHGSVVTVGQTGEPLETVRGELFVSAVEDFEIQLLSSGGREFLRELKGVTPRDHIVVPALVDGQREKPGDEQFRRV